MPRGLTVERRAAITEANQGVTNAWFRDRIICAGWCIYRVDEINMVLERETGIKGNPKSQGTRTYYPNAYWAFRALFEILTNDKTKKSLEQCLIAYNHCLEEIKMACVQNGHVKEEEVFTREPDTLEVKKNATKPSVKDSNGQDNKSRRGRPRKDTGSTQK